MTPRARESRRDEWSLQLPKRSTRNARDAESTQDLLRKAHSGEQEAFERIYKRFVPALRRWAAGRIPPRARGLVDTDDVVQVSIVRALSSLDRFESRRPGAFLAYLHQVLINCVRDEIRRAERRPLTDSDDALDDRLVMIERTLGSNLVDLYELALGELSERHQESIVLRIEFGLTYREIGQALGRSSANAVRMEIARGLAALAQRMADLEAAD